MWQIIQKKIQLEQLVCDSTTREWDIPLICHESWCHIMCRPMCFYVCVRIQWIFLYMMHLKNRYDQFMHLAHQIQDETITTAILTWCCNFWYYMKLKCLLNSWQWLSKVIISVFAHPPIDAHPNIPEINNMQNLIHW